MDGTREKFLDIAEKRTRKTLKDIQLIGNLSNKVTYNYSADDVEQIFKALEGELRIAKQRFQAQPTKKSAEFSLR